ncbi:MAG: rhodanese-like domain-containing protein [Pseudomonadales bacterium]|jgi:thiosulfate/3-mercaptopyruvate sulfurtransferase|nr:rhodanese-like domain-containing protein [Pseudomonadales bacterium]
MPLDTDRLLTPAELAAALDAEPPTADLLVVDVGTPDRYARAHVPGAMLVTPPELVSGIPPASGTLPDLERLEALIERLGLADDTVVVAYDDEGGGWAGRLLWTLEVVGHRAWKYLDGGIHAWHAEGMPLSSAPPERPPRSQRLTLDRSHVAEAEDVLLASETGSAQIWDARSHAEYTGERVSAARGGHVPGARHLDWLDLMDQDRALRLRTDLEDVIARAGIDLARPVITHCQSHHRSGLSWLVARLLGAADVRAYHGSWGEWGNRADLPVRTGAEP